MRNAASGFAKTEKRRRRRRGATLRPQRGARAWLLRAPASLSEPLQKQEEIDDRSDAAHDDDLSLFCFFVLRFALFQKSV
jgi:hypothetical protein